MTVLSKKNFYSIGSADGVNYTVNGANLNLIRYFKESAVNGTGNDDGVFTLNETVVLSAAADFAPLATDEGRYYRGRYGEGNLVQASGYSAVLYSDTVYNIGYTFTLDTSDYVLPDTDPPAAPIVTGISSDSGTGGDGITNDPTLSLSGTAEANATVELFRTVGGVTTSLGTTDILFGEDGDDTLTGNEGKDTVVGGAGNDLLFGGAANDVLFADGGADTLWGWSGADLFAFGRASGGSVVMDFQVGVDRLAFYDATIDLGAVIRSARVEGGNTTLDIGSGIRITILGQTGNVAGWFG